MTISPTPNDAHSHSRSPSPSPSHSDADADSPANGYGLTHTHTRTRTRTHAHALDESAALGPYTSHMFSMIYEPEAGWHKPQLLPLEPLSLHPATAGLYNGQVVFEDVIAHRRVDDSIALFRPWDHARRLRQSARRLAMPELPDDLFVSALEELVEADAACLVPSAGAADAGTSSLVKWPTTLRLRTLMLATDEALALRPADHFRFIVTASITSDAPELEHELGPGLEREREREPELERELGTAPGIAVMLNREYGRAIPGGSGEANAAGNHAPTFLARRRALDVGCQDVVWLDATQRCWVEGLGGMSLFIVRGNRARPLLSTPELDGTIPPDVARDSALLLAARMGYLTKQERITVGRWRSECERGVITELFGCTPLGVIVPITAVHDGSASDADVWTVSNGKPGPVTAAVSRALTEVQRGMAPAPRGWLYQIPADE